MVGCTQARKAEDWEAPHESLRRTGEQPANPAPPHPTRHTAPSGCNWPCRLGGGQIGITGRQCCCESASFVAHTPQLPVPTPQHLLSQSHPIFSRSFRCCRRPGGSLLLGFMGTALPVSCLFQSLLLPTTAALPNKHAKRVNYSP